MVLFLGEAFVRTVGGRRLPAPDQTFRKKHAQVGGKRKEPSPEPLTLICQGSCASTFNA